MPTTWNPSDVGGSATFTLTNGNLTATITSATGSFNVRSVDRVSTGKYYWEITYGATYTALQGLGISTISTNLGSSSNQTAANGLFTAQVSNAGIYAGGVSTGISLGTITAGTVLCVALDMTNRLIWFRNGAAGNWNNNAGYSPAAGTGGVALTFCGPGFPAYAFYTTSNATNGTSVIANFGATAYAGTAPSGFGNLPTGTTSTSNEIATQLALEQWASTIPPNMQATQLALEYWVSNNVTTPQMIATQLGVEMWAGVAAAIAAQQARAMILA